jgi:hypothetical protein
MFHVKHFWVCGKKEAKMDIYDIVALIETRVRELTERYLEERLYDAVSDVLAGSVLLGEAAANAINRSRLSQGKEELEL